VITFSIIIISPILQLFVIVPSDWCIIQKMRTGDSWYTSVRWLQQLAVTVMLLMIICITAIIESTFCDVISRRISCVRWLVAFLACSSAGLLCLHFTTFMMFIWCLCRQLNCIIGAWHYWLDFDLEKCSISIMQTQVQIIS